MKVRVLFASLLSLVLAGLFLVPAGSTGEQNLPFPSYGSGPVEVRIYSDYFCPPCRAMEPAASMLLKGLLKKKAIRLTLVDTPFHPYTSLFAKYFLYALKMENDVDNAFRVRNVLIGASADKSITTEKQIEEIFKGKGIFYMAFDVKPAFNRYNALITEDKIKATPTCVIIRKGQKKTVVGGPDIIKALKSLP